jgi:thiopurine S-methyltransferase
MSSEKPAHQRPELPDFWQHRFQSGLTPWDAGCAPQALQDFVANYAAKWCPLDASRPPRVLIPGCGSAWDAAFLDQCGWDVSALDFSSAALEVARTTLGSGWRGQLHCADFFRFSASVPFDVIYERAFLCALPRQRWPDYPYSIARLLPAGGLLAGYFYFSEEPKGPPFGILRQGLEELLAAHFILREDCPVDDSLPVFAGKERWQVWEKRAPVALEE